MDFVSIIVVYVFGYNFFAHFNNVLNYSWCTNVNDIMYTSNLITLDYYNEESSRMSDYQTFYCSFVSYLSAYGSRLINPLSKAILE